MKQKITYPHEFFKNIFAYSHMETVQIFVLHDQLSHWNHSITNQFLRNLLKNYLSQDMQEICYSHGLALLC